ncbi:MAG: DNA methyltransferase [Gammaproteobacteria bacterium]|nr:DNA methyltransferase [Gammaproteobacteria bacterium]MDD9960529.1 DNA methyltransferase [Gammaproteobacteria bacterium]MDD9964173.1 DNA methyltransferase [Gammaproteobacteria bacterium]MDE0272938.1 DNA methyltransferase [Gammaproteobacteria bacterium]
MAQFLSTAEVAGLAGVHRDTLLRWLRNGTVPEPRRDGRGWRVFSARDVAAVVAYANGGEEETEDDPAITRLKAVEWDFATAKTGYLTHNLHPYPAKFIPQIPNALIQELSAVGDTVADIFCGSGTTLLEAMLLKRHAVGIDANPLAALISKAKTTPFNAAGVEALEQHCQACRQVAESIEPNVGDLFHDGRPFGSSGWRPAAEICEFWFEPHVVEELAELRRLIDEVPGKAERRLGMVTLAAIVVAVSKQDSDTRYVRRDKAIAPGDTIHRYLAQLQSAMVAVREINALMDDRFRCRVFHANVLDGPDVGPLDLVVASPPYPNAYSYHLYHRSRLAWLGFDPNQFKRVEMGSHRKYSAKGRNRATPDTFAQEFAKIFQWLRVCLRERGYVCLVVGDSTLNGERIDNASLIADAGATAGFREVARIGRNIAPTRKAFNPRIGKIKSENILVLRKR